jgi:hypothetical protein
MNKVQEFLAKAQENAKNKAVEMAKLELSIWDKNHETELKSQFGFSEIKIRNRKKELKSIAQ